MPPQVNSKNLNYLVEKNTTKSYDIIANNSFTLNVIDIINKNTTINLHIKLNKSAKFYINIYILNNGFQKIVNLKINHDSSSVSNTMVKTLASKKGHIKLNLVNIASKGTTNIEQNQQIEGILFDENSKIDVTPSMLIDTNVIKASHAVNIGNINPEQLFYLMSRGLNKTKATWIILKSMFAGLTKNKNSTDLYNKVIKQLNKMLKEK